MRLTTFLFKALVLGVLVFSVSCCCTGGLDNTDIPMNIHNEGHAEGGGG
jgi:hypothetical protein